MKASFRVAALGRAYPVWSPDRAVTAAAALMEALEDEKGQEPPLGGSPSAPCAPPTASPYPTPACAVGSFLLTKLSKIY